VGGKSLARRNSEHAERLRQVPEREGSSTRDLKFEHYQSASHAMRERMVEYPRRLLRALEERRAERGSRALRDGPDAAVASEIRQIEALIARLRRRLSTLQPVPEGLISAMPRVKAALAALHDAVTWSITHDTSRDLFERACASLSLRAQGHTVREISRLLHLARNTVRRIYVPRRRRQRAKRGCGTADTRAERPAEAFGKAGVMPRAREPLPEQSMENACSSSLTRQLRKVELRHGEAARAGRYHPLRPDDELTIRRLIGSSP